LVYSSKGLTWRNHKQVSLVVLVVLHLKVMSYTLLLLRLLRLKPN
jgi:hypothetical protein